MVIKKILSKHQIGILQMTKFAWTKQIFRSLPSQANRASSYWMQIELLDSIFRVQKHKFDGGNGLS